MKLHWNLRVRKSLRGFFASLGKAAPLRRVSTARPRVEQLEDRTVPTTLTVTSGADPATLTPGTLRYEVNQANTDANAGQSDNIVFSGVTTFVIQVPADPIVLSGHNGSATITIGSTNAGQVNLNANGLSRMFLVDSGVSVTLNNLNIYNGSAGSLGGGGVYNAGTLTMNGCTISECTSSGSGGGVNNTATMTMNGSIISNNTASGVESGGINNAGTITSMSACTVSGNNPGGVNNAGTITSMSACTISGNTVAAGISNSGTIIDISSSTISGNSSGGIFNTGVLTIRGSTVDGNSSLNGGGLYNFAGISGDQGIATVSGCTFSNNTATSSGTQSQGGGGIYTDGGTLTVSRSTISGNSAGFGGGIYNYFSTMTITGSTIASNEYGAGVLGGGLYLWGASAPTVLVDTIIAGNGLQSQPNTFPDVYDLGNQINPSSAGNVFGVSTGVSNLLGNDNYLGVGSAAVALGPLENNGGPTDTMAMGPGSIAFGNGVAPTTLANAVNTTTTTFVLANASRLGMVPGVSQLLVDGEIVLVQSVNGNTLTVQRGINGIDIPHNAGAWVYPSVDQRGDPRLRNGQLDIGAYEYQGSLVPTTTSLTDNGPNPSNTTQAQPVYFTVNVSPTVPNGETVQLYDGSLSSPVGAPGALSGGSVSIPVAANALNVGTNIIFAVYSGDANYAGSQSNSVAQIVNLTPTSTTLTDIGPNPSMAGQNVAFAVTVSPTVPNGETVTLEDANNSNAVVGSGTLTGATVTINIANLAVGSHDIFAVYSGDGTYASSQSGQVTQVVNSAPTTVNLSLVDINSDANDTAIYDDGTQRSMVDSVVYHFNTAVNLDAGAFTIALHSGITVTLGNGSQTTTTVGTVPDATTWSSPDGGYTWVVTFAGAGVTGGASIADGVYDITLNAAHVTTANGGSVTLDNFQGGTGSETDTFWCLFGDANQDQKVTAQDYCEFASTYLTRASNPAYIPWFDQQGDGAVTAQDYGAFASNYLKKYSGFTPTI